MGLGFSQGKASWSYSGFHRFRVKLASEIGVELDKMNGFSEGTLSWDNIKDAIVLLLNHSDCGGHLSSEDCAKVAPRLLKLVENWDEDYDKIQALQLVEAMKQCAEAEEDLRFV